jgi:hypothetical protein
MEIDIWNELRALAMENVKQLEHAYSAITVIVTDNHLCTSIPTQPRLDHYAAVVVVVQ